MFRVVSMAAAICLAAASVFAINITVAPTTGTPGGDPTNTIIDAISQINAAGPGAHTITLRSTEGPHSQPATTTAVQTSWEIAGGIDVDFVAESGQPIVLINWTSGRYMLTIRPASPESVITFTDIAFIPETGLTYVNNIADGIHCEGGTYQFTNCVFSNNDGFNGVNSQDGSTPYQSSTAGNNVGDDWIQFDTNAGDVTFSNCTLTGCNDDAILIGSHTTGHTLTLNQGTNIANIGGAAIQVFGANTAVVLDGSAGRVQMAQLGLRAAPLPSPAADTGPKFFWDVGCSLTMNQADLMNATNGGIFDFEGVPNIGIIDSRIAFCNTSNTATAGLLAVDDLSNDSGSYAQNINITRSTFHDTGGTTNNEAIATVDLANEPNQIYNIIDSIFSGANDDYDDMTNSLSSNGPSSVNLSFSATVTAGPHALGNLGDLPTGSVTADPNYKSLVYTIGRSQANPEFLLPFDSGGGGPYNNAASNGADLLGGAGSAGGTLPAALTDLSAN